MAPQEGLLAFNAGSSSLKVEWFARGRTWQSHARAAVAGIGRERAAVEIAGMGAAVSSRTVSRRIDHAAAAELLLDELTGAGAAPGRWLATVHRVVHGGEVFTSPVRVTPEVLAQIDTLTPLAPLHNPPAVDVLRAVARRLGAVPAVAVFDTAFFRDLPEAARTYAIPRAWRAQGSVRRFGFHGIAHEYLWRRSAALGKKPAARVVTLQLGSGCSAAALLDGRPVETSMGFTPLEGLVMGTRAGDIDPGILVHQLRSGASWQVIDAALNRESGLLGLSGETADMTELLELERRGDSRAALAIAVFCHRVRKYVGAYAAVLGGLDALVFGGGIGENAAMVRSRICRDFEWLGLELDERANLIHADAVAGGSEAVVSRASSAVAVHVIPVHEERVLAQRACACLDIDAAGLEL